MPFDDRESNPDRLPGGRVSITPSSASLMPSSKVKVNRGDKQVGHPAALLEATGQVLHLTPAAKILLMNR